MWWGVPCSHPLMGVEASRAVNVGSFYSGQKHPLDFHSGNVFVAPRVAL